jgi:regulator of PEP synthase PpsR (kinase-PPPase family)
VREARAAQLGRNALGEYLDYKAVSRELPQANRLMAAHGWHSIDASYLAVEEIGHEIMRLRGLP